MNRSNDIEKQHSKGKLFVEERLRLLFDDGVYHEITDEETRDGVYICEGYVSGKMVIAAAQDFCYKGGTLGARHGSNIALAMDMAIKKRCPFLSINDSGGARIQEGVNALAGYGDIFFRNTKASGYIPQISVIAGPCAGGAVYSPGIMDFIFVVDSISQMFITGPKVVKAVIGENLTGDELGGAAVHAQKSGVAHVRCQDERQCFAELRRLVSMLPSSNRRQRFKMKPDTAVRNFSFQIPENPRRGYDVRELITQVFDADSFFELQPEFARSVVTGFAFLGGATVGIIASQPSFMAGILDCDSSDKAARFVRFCDAFNIPIVTFTDVPGYLPGRQQESSGIIRHGAKLLYAFAEATVPKINIILRKAYGGAYIAMNSLHIGADYTLAIKNAEVAVMGEQGAVEIIYAKEASAMEPAAKQQFLAQRAEEYRKTTMNVQCGLQGGYINELIDLPEIRGKVMELLRTLSHKRRRSLKKKHGNIPL